MTEPWKSGKQRDTALGDFLSDARKARGLTLNTAAAALGIALSHLSKLEHGQRRDLHIDTLYRLYLVYGVDANALLAAYMYDEPVPVAPEVPPELAAAAELVRQGATVRDTAASTGVKPADLRRACAVLQVEMRRGAPKGPRAKRAEKPQ